MTSLLGQNEIARWKACPYGYYSRAFILQAAVENSAGKLYSNGWDPQELPHPAPKGVIQLSVKPSDGFSL